MQKTISQSDLKTDAQQAADIFLKTAAYIRKYGWQEKGMSEDKKPRCSMGALSSACQGRVLGPRVASLLYETLYEKLGGINLTQYNAQVKSGEEVAVLFEQTAKLLQNNFNYHAKNHPPPVVRQRGQRGR